MEVRVAKTAGFCFGVKRAVDTVYEEIEKKDGDICTYGPIIHNEEVCEDLADKGVLIINSEEELRSATGKTIVIRSHGVGPDIYKVIEENGNKCVDATCPFVKKIHKIVADESSNGRYIIIIGDSTHPEVVGIKDYVKNGRVTIIGNEQDAINFSINLSEKLTIVSQTTFNYNKFKELVEIMYKKGYDVNTMNTICSATKERQEEAFRLAKEADKMIVIGGSHSSNTQKLYELCKKECNNTYYIQTFSDLSLEDFITTDVVGITAGASTPHNIIEEVQRNVRTKF